MTHVKNIPHILKHGITHQNSPNANTDYIPIGYATLITKRERVMVPGRKKLSDYIPFYFGFRMPMLYVIKLGSNSVKYDMNQISSEDIIYCITDIESILKHQLGFVFTNGHAVSDLTDFFSEDRINNIHELIDINAITARYWNDENDLDLKRRKEAEFLLESDMPFNTLLGFVVLNESAKQKLIDYGVNEDIIAIKPQYYF